MAEKIKLSGVPETDAANGIRPCQRKHRPWCHSRQKSVGDHRRTGLRFFPRRQGYCYAQRCDCTHTGTRSVGGGVARPKIPVQW